MMCKMLITFAVVAPVSCAFSYDLYVQGWQLNDLD